VPQFIDPAAHDKAVAFIALGCIFNINSLLWSHGLALTAAAAGRRMRSGRRPRQALSRLTGAVFVAFGVRLAVAARH
jgi:threonine/homoserine/homoserine lactone efflux protein